MKIISAGYEILTPIDEAEFYRKIERIGRICYKSEAAITDESAEKFVRNLVKRQHEAMLEHESITVKFIVDRGVSHELVRHRLASFAQESTRYCVAGDSKLTFKNPHMQMTTIADLYQNIQESSNGAWKRTHIKQYNEKTGELEFAKIKGVYYNGKKPCSKISTRLKYDVTCTNDHEILTKDGYKKLSDLKVGDKIYVNGISLLYTNYDWMYNQNITLNKTFVQIARDFGFNVSTLKTWARKLNIPKKGTGYFHIGRTPWNKGLTDERQANALRKFHHCGRRKEGIMKQDTVNYQKYNSGLCEICGAVNKNSLEVHHIDLNHDYNDPKNLITLCESCHQRVHSHNLLTAYLDEIISIEPVGEQDVYDIEMDSNYHNFIANGIVVHNCNYSHDKFGKEITVIEPCFFSDIPEEEKRLCRKAMDFFCQFDDEITKFLNGGVTERHRAYARWYDGCLGAEHSYFALLEQGCTPQEARDVLPTSVKTEIVMTANLREWRHFLKLRAAGTTGAPHPQMSEVAVPLLKELQRKLPAVFDDITLTEA